jgi:hypothetical protein
MKNWIKISERLPEIETPVFVFADNERGVAALSKKKCVGRSLDLDPDIRRLRALWL